VPDEIRVSGWDNSVPPDAVKPSLTTLDVPFIQIGRGLATLPEPTPLRVTGRAEPWGRDDPDRA